jgi:hypothetical protein
MFHTTEDIHIQWTKVVLPPVFLEEEFPVTEAASETIFKTRNEITEILGRQRFAAAGAGGALLDSLDSGRARVRPAAEGCDCRVFQRVAHRDAGLL